MKKVFVIGIDALNPRLLLKLVKDGELPNFKKLMEIGGFSKALSALPAQTPENWTSIATGAWPGTHGIATWGRRFPNVSVTEYFGDESMSSNLCRAEYLWEALARRGLRSVLLNFVGYPPTTDKAVYIDWFWRPGRWYFEICSAACYLSKESLKDLMRTKAPAKQMLEKSLLIPVDITGNTEDWRNLPESMSPPLSFKLTLRPVRSGEDVTLNGLLINEEGKGYDTLLICRGKDPEKVLCKLKTGQWGFFYEEFKVEGKKYLGTVRLKLVELSYDGARLKIYRSQVHPASEFAYPPEIGKELTSRFGPYINEAVERFIRILDKQTIIEEFTYQIRWIANAAKYLMEKGASLYMMHWHLLDTVQHAFLSSIDPTAGGYNPEKEKEGWEMLKISYRLADILVGEFLKLLDDGSYIIVVSDHGHVPNRKRFPLLKALMEAGLITVEKNENGDLIVDWERSKIHISTTNIYVNLKSRYKNGIVEDSEYEEVRNQLIDLLRSLKDEEGNYVISFAFKREDAPIIGLWGESVGDVVYAYSPGYTWSHNRFEENVSIDKGANHGPQIPTAETIYGSNYAVFMIAGPKIKKGYIRPIEMLGPVLTVDIAPTVSYLLDVDPPRHSQGRILYDFLEEWDVSEVKRERRKLKFPGEPQPIIGDVTEYILP